MTLWMVCFWQIDTVRIKLLITTAIQSLSSTLRISPQIAEKAETTVSENGDYKTTTTKYAYDDYRFNLTAEVDAVQTHNAQEAIQERLGCGRGCGGRRDLEPAAVMGGAKN